MNYLEESVVCEGSGLCCPFLSPSGAVQYVSSGSGEVYSIENGKHKVLFMSGGQPYGAAYDSKGHLYLADCAQKAILRAEEGNKKPGVVVKIYEDKPFKGPNGVAFDQEGTMFFTDSGPFGETTLQKPMGSVYCIRNSSGCGQILRPLVLECLAHPAGIAVSSNGKYVYVAEMMTNRVLRLAQHPKGVYHCSVFHQLKGGVGPSCLACDANGRVFVGTFDWEHGSDRRRGKVHVLNSEGDYESSFEVPGSEITGMTIKGRLLYVTEASTNTLHGISLAALFNE